MVGPLSGIRVIDLTQVLFGPFCTMLLSDMGADVIKVERQEDGDMARGNGPFVDGISTYFFSLNRGKKSITINLSSDKGREVFMKLAEKADVLVENYVPGTMEKFGLGYTEVSARNPGIIYVAGSGFGLEGPYARKPAFDVIIQAMGGVMSHTGEPGGNPVRPGVSYGDIAGGLFLCIATLAALQERNSSGKGQMVDVSMLDCQVTVQENAFVRYLNTGEITRPLGTRHPVISPFQTFPTSDGHVAVALRGGVKNQWPLFCAVINRIDLIDDPRFKTGWLRTKNYSMLEPAITAIMKTKTTAKWVDELEAVGIPCGPLNNIQQAAGDKHLQARNMFLEIDNGHGGKLRVVNSPFKFSRTPVEVEKPAPSLGANNTDILGNILGLSNEEIELLKRERII